eukprot:TRINITY_DN872_c3_g2_i1.p1 TRINITY_DN872_c3_g2~~TRINITY_DN872_c3_g2_i1.p1  ORF type:complete len:283 (-),score=-1.01 TRINITY_DN872_c3_g2_i1:378-1226(-)
MVKNFMLLHKRKFMWLHTFSFNDSKLISKIFESRFANTQIFAFFKYCFLGLLGLASFSKKSFSFEYYIRYYSFFFAIYSGVSSDFLYENYLVLSRFFYILQSFNKNYFVFSNLGYYSGSEANVVNHFSFFSKLHLFTYTSIVYNVSFVGLHSFIFYEYYLSYKSAILNLNIFKKKKKIFFNKELFVELDKYVYPFLYILRYFMDMSKNMNSSLYKYNMLLDMLKKGLLGFFPQGFYKNQNYESIEPYSVYKNYNMLLKSKKNVNKLKGGTYKYKVYTRYKHR